VKAWESVPYVRFDFVIYQGPGKGGWPASGPLVDPPKNKAPASIGVGGPTDKGPDGGRLVDLAENRTGRSFHRGPPGTKDSSDRWLRRFKTATSAGVQTTSYWLMIRSGGGDRVSTIL